MPTVTFTAASQTSTDETGTMTITAQLSAQSGRDVTVPFTVNASSTADGTGVDYSITGSPITITEGSISEDITITIATDALDEYDETVVVDMGTLTNADPGATTSHTATITDDDAMPTVTFTTASQTSTDETGTMTITAQLSAQSGRDVTVPFTVNASSTADGTGVDYSITGSPITITEGSTSEDITITIATDALDEYDETVVVDMGTLTNADPGATTSHTATITDDDAMPTVTFTTASQTSTDETGTMTITAQLSAQSGRDVTVPFTVNAASTSTGGGTDYSITGSPITIAEGSTTADITITITTDHLVEGDETIIVDMGTLVNANQGTTNSHSATVTDNDIATLRVTRKANAYENVSDGSFYVVTDKQFDSDVNVGVSVLGTATSGVDYTTIVSPRLFPAFTDTLTVTVAQIDDSQSEINEYVIINLVGTDNARVYIAPAPDSTATVTIFDDDLPLVTMTQSVTTFSETLGQNILSATLNKVHYDDVIVTLVASGTATPTNDFTLPATITVEAGNLTGTATLAAVQDQMVESDETVIVDILSIVNGVEDGTQQVSSTIVDDDVSVLSVAVTTGATEDTADGLFTISATKQFDSPVTLTFGISGSAVEGSDFHPIGTTVFFPDSTSSVTIPVDVIADNLVEFDEAVILSLVSTTNPDVTVAPSVGNSATMPVNDNDTSNLSIHKIRDAAEGGATGGLFTIYSDKMHGLPVDVYLSISGMATGGSDYGTIGLFVEFPAYTNSLDIPVNITDDLLVEGRENIDLNMTGTERGSVRIQSGSSRAFMDINDNDYAHLYVLSYGDAREADINGLFSVNTDKPVEWDVPIELTLGGTATSGTDYSPIKLPAILPAHQNQLLISMFPISDEVVEANETVALSVVGADNENILFSTLPGDAAVVNIVDDDTAHFTITATGDPGEGSADGSFLISSTKIFTEPVTLYLGVSGSAVPGVDYGTINTEFIFPASVNTDTLPVPVVDDGLVEGGEVVIVSIDSVLHGRAIVDLPPLDGPATVLIRDNDFATISIETVHGASEDGTPGLFRLISDHPVETGVTVTHVRMGSATEGLDYLSLGNSVSLPAHTLSVELPVTVLPDMLDEDFENVMVELTGTSNENVLTGAPSHHWASLVIEDDDPEPMLSIQPVSGSEGSGSFLFEVALSPLSGKQVSVKYGTPQWGDALPGADFGAVSGTLDFMPGDSIKIVAVPVTDDQIDEYDETFQLLLSGPVNAGISVNNGLGTIVDNDSVPGVVLSFAADRLFERSSPTYLKAGLDIVSGKTVVVTLDISGDAMSGVDYTIENDSIIILPGQLSDSILVAPVTDGLDEQEEQLVVRIGKAQNAHYNDTLSSTLVIIDQEQTITFGPLPAKIYGGTAFLLEASSTSGLGVVFTSSNPGVASITGSLVTITGAGTATITASQPGNDLYDPAEGVSQNLTVGKAGLSIEAEDAGKNYNEPNPVLILSYFGFVNGDDANALDVVPTISTTASASSGAGQYPISVSGGSDDDYEFTYTNGTLTVNKAPQTITFGSLPEVKKGDAPLTLTATSTSGLAVMYESSDPSKATISGSTAVIVESGTVEITAKQGGDLNYLPAADVTRVLVIKTPDGAEVLKYSGPLCYPNPFDNTIYLNGVCEKAVSVKMYDLNGKLVLTKHTATNQVDGSTLRGGVYLLEVDFGQGIVLKRQVVKK